MNSKPGFFPMFMDVRDKELLFVGGGRIASRRIKVLSDFDTRICVVAPTLSDELTELADAKKIDFIADKMSITELLNYAAVIEAGESVAANNSVINAFASADIVFACTDDSKLNHVIYQVCKSLGKLVNNCSNHSECDFYFPGIVQQENIVIGVNAGGNAHSQAKDIRKKIEDVLNEK